MPSRLERMARNWDVTEKESFMEKIGKLINPPPPMKQRIALALYKVKVQASKLEHMFNRLQERDRILFEKVVGAQMMKDMARAAIYANEVAEVRKIAKTILRAQLALEQVALRLETVQQLGDVLTTMAPVVSVIRNIKSQLIGVVPEIAFELSEIDDILQTVVIEVGQFTGQRIDVTAMSAEAKKILDEAAIIAEQRMKEKFPELPAATSQAVNELPAPPK